MDSKDERGTVRLNIDGVSHFEYEPSNFEQSPYQVRLSKFELYEQYRLEIDELIQEEKKKITLEYGARFKKELSIKEKEIKEILNEKECHLTDVIHKFEKFLDLANAEFKTFCNSELFNLNGLIIDVVMEVLYKIIGNNDLYKDIVSSTVNNVIERKLNGMETFIIKVSGDDYLFFKTNLSDQAWIKNIKVDDRLSVGQMVFENGFSIYECGLLDQLDLLRTELIAALRTNYE